MKKNVINVLATLVLVASINLAGMERKIIPGMQKMITIPCLDGENERKFELERWKVSESNSLLSHCLWYDPNFESVDGLLEVPKIPVQYKTLELFSKACDVTSGDQFKKFFKELKSEQQKELIIATGPVDKNGKRQFNAPGLIAQIFDVSFKQNWCDKHVKPFLQRVDWVEYCLNKVVNNNLMDSLLPQISIFKDDREIMEHENGKLSIVPLCLKAKGSLYDGPCTPIQEIIHNDAWRMVRRKTIDNAGEACKNVWEHCITPVETINSVNEVPGNKAVIWAINNTTKSVSKTVVEHKNDIIKFFFSNNGEYVITRSQEDIFVSKIIHMHDGSARFDTYRVEHDEYVMDVCFDNHSHRLITCSAGDDCTGVVKLLDISGRCIARMEGLGVIDKAVLSPDGHKLLILSQIIDKKNIVTLCTIADYIHHDAQFAISGKENAVFDRIICSSDGTYWAMTTKIGGIVFIPAFGAQCEAFELVDSSLVNPENEMRILFSSDSRFLIALVQKSTTEPLMLEVWSTFNGKKIVSQYSFGGQDLDCGIGLTPFDRELVCFYGNRSVYTRPFFCEQDEQILSHLCASTTVYGLSLLRRLARAHKNKQSVELYEEEPAYKALINMQKKPLDVAGFVEKYLPWKVINNKKGVGLLLQETWKNLFS